MNPANKPDPTNIIRAMNTTDKSTLGLANIMSSLGIESKTLLIIANTPVAIAMPNIHAAMVKKMASNNI